MPELDTTRVVLGDDYYGYRFPVPREFVMDLMASLEDRWAVLAGIGITPEHGATPLIAWRNAVAAETVVDPAVLDPDRGGRLDLGFSPAYVRAFVHFLA